MKKIKLFALSLVAALAFAACSDDDDSLTDKFNDASDEYTDLLGNQLDPLHWTIDWRSPNNGPIYGKAKTVETVLDYSTMTWDSTTNKVIAQYPYTKTISEYNKAGFWTKTSGYTKTTGEPLLENRKFRESSRTIRTLDSRNRSIEENRSYLYYSTNVAVTPTKDYIDGKTITTYDDANKTATAIYYYTNDEGVTFLQGSKTVYKLFKNGRIDLTSGIQYTRASLPEDDFNKPSSSNSIETPIVDSHKNWLEAYQKNCNYNSFQTWIGGYKTRTITYY